MAGYKEHAPGTFCYVEVATTDPSAAGEFYGSLFGWKRNDEDMGDHGIYTQFTLRDRIVAAMHKLTPDQAAQGVPPHWGLYITVADLDAATARVDELGGQVLMGPMDIADAGRMAVIRDPQGAGICLWQAKAHCGVHVRDEVDSLCWSELMTTDTDAAVAFYGGLLGWEPQTSDTDGMRHYTSFSAGSVSVAGMMALTPEMGPITPNWLAYFAVADCPAAEKKAAGLGAAALVPTTAIPAIGHFAVLQDPQGVVFGIFQPAAR